MPELQDAYQMLRGRPDGIMKRVGIYSGTFDPVHAGHIGFALQAIEKAGLSAVYFLPERQPRHKQGVEHFAHRVAMLKAAARPHPRLHVLELVDVNFSVERTLPKLRQKFKNNGLVFLIGSDQVAHLPQWPRAERLLGGAGLVVGVRNTHDAEGIEKQIAGWQQQPQSLHVFESFAADVSSGGIREALRLGRPIRGLLTSVRRYSDRHWLYVSFSRARDANHL